MKSLGGQEVGKTGLHLRELNYARVHVLVS